MRPSRSSLSDDPLGREPETANASGAKPWDVDLFYDLSYNLFVTSGREPANIRAQNVNTIDEVPDSSWFTNRIGSSRGHGRRSPARSRERAGTGSGAVDDHAREERGDAPGFTAQDAGGQTWFVSFDSPANREGATGAAVVATKIFWALGYNQVEYFLTQMHPETIAIAGGATRRRPSGKRTR